MDQYGGNASPGNLFSSSITAFHDKDSLEPRPGNKYNPRRFSAHLEEHLVKEKRITKFPLVGALVHKALRRREEAEDEKVQITGPEDNQHQQNNNNNDWEPNRMVLPFGLGPDGHHVDAIQSAPAPSAPPAHMMPPAYARGQTNIYTGVPIIVNPYIDFIVVNGDDRYMIRCERKSVLERSVELAKLIHAGPNSGRKSDNHFQILNVDKNDFELIVRYMEKHFIPYRDHKHLLKILELSDRFNVPDLIIYCIRELDLRISSATALDIFKALWFYQGIALTNQHQTVITTQETGQQLARKKATKAKAAAKQLAAAKASQSTENGAEGDGAQQNLIPNPNPFTTEDYGVALLHNTLQLIDMHAELQLSMPEISDLRFEELETLVKRDTLQLRSEVTLFECLATWSLAECARKHIDATPENRRTVLGPLCLTPRYLRMTASEFRRCCERLELLPPTEISLITDALDGKKLKNLTDQQAELLEKFRQPRAEYARMPVHLSDRSSPKNYPKKMRLAHEGRPTEDGCWEKVGMNCLRIFVCIFD
uniref:Axundead, isoform A n=3 Tax=Drosophila melanogaster TaxID=7227 RepID=Q9VRX8_DROME|eukprot:NP_648051.1 axundead, isoform A [Drosophila melanogaster]